MLSKHRQNKVTVSPTNYQTFLPLGTAAAYPLQICFHFCPTRPHLLRFLQSLGLACPWRFGPQCGCIEAVETFKRLAWKKLIGHGVLPLEGMWTGLSSSRMGCYQKACL
jgi:hypothetical protein